MTAALATKQPMAWTEIHHRNADDLALALSQTLGQCMDEAIAARSRAQMALAGGRTSPPVYRRLAAQQRDWNSVHLMPSDERWVTADHPDCNLRQMIEAFHGAQGIHWIALVPMAASGPVNAGFAVAALNALPGPFDAVLLGMGSDGHFGSLFPGSPNLAEALDPHSRVPAFAIEPDPLPAAGPQPRVSLSLARMLDTRKLLLAITGDEKLEVLRRAQQQAHASGLPVAALLHAPNAQVEIHWSP